MAGIKGNGETLQTRLQRLAAAAERSLQTAQDDVRAFHDACDDARRNHGRTYGWIAQAIGKSRTQTFRIANALTGPRARGE